MSAKPKNPSSKWTQEIRQKRYGKNEVETPLPSGQAEISQTLSAQSETPAGNSSAPTFILSDLAQAFPLPWSHYVEFFLAVFKIDG